MELVDPAAVRWLIAWGGRVRDRFLGPAVELCAIVNARSGRCPEDCAFCAQSAGYRTDIEVYPLLAQKDILDASARAARAGARRFSIVVSGRGPGGADDFDRMVDAVAEMAGAARVWPCASLGLIDEARAARLKAAGLVRYHHNLEAPPSFFPEICTTHTYADRVRTIEVARAAGLEICAGGIIGLGESAAQRLELGLELRVLGVDSVALNVLDPIPGTPLEGVPPLPPLEVLKTIAVFRLLMPATEIRTCGGRERALRGVQPMMYLAGASGTMIGDYLTTAGRDSGQDLMDVQDLGLCLAEI
ncbi:MAG: biotin synthase BioB [Proteobacteria bacterium]|nr:biotin synthase BioB [Pseudomonadota bacterium]